MNIFRLAGDVSHLVAIIILLLKIWRSKSCAGISGKSQVLFALVFTTRYLDLFTVYISAYNTVMKVVFLAMSYATVYLIYMRFRNTDNSENDTFRVEFLLVPVIGLSFLENYAFTPMEIMWTFSIFLEAVAIMPQLFMITKTGEAESITTHYLFFLGLYRALYIANWVWRYHTEGFFDHIAVVSGVVQTIFYCDFFYLYVTRDANVTLEMCPRCARPRETLALETAEVMESGDAARAAALSIIFTFVTAFPFPSSFPMIPAPSAAPFPTAVTSSHQKSLSIRFLASSSSLLILSNSGLCSSFATHRGEQLQSTGEQRGAPRHATTATGRCPPPRLGIDRHSAPLIKSEFSKSKKVLLSLILSPKVSSISITDGEDGPLSVSSSMRLSVGKMSANSAISIGRITSLMLGGKFCSSRYPPFTTPSINSVASSGRSMTPDGAEISAERTFSGVTLTEHSNRKTGRSSVTWVRRSRASCTSLVSSASRRACCARCVSSSSLTQALQYWDRKSRSYVQNSPPTHLKDLQRHGEPRLFGPHQRPVAGAEVLTGRKQQHHGHLVSKLQQLPDLTNSTSLLLSIAPSSSPLNRFRPLPLAVVHLELLIEHVHGSGLRQQRSSAAVLFQADQGHPVERRVKSSYSSALIASHLIRYSPYPQGTVGQVMSPTVSPSGSWISTNREDVLVTSMD
ncbi:hypothetical protein FQN60_003538, partial [Etheostoma spectabile]